MSQIKIPDSELLQAGFRYAFSLSSNRQDAEDLIHDAWLRLVKRYGGSPDKPLLFKTIRNLYIDTRRREKVRLAARDSLQYSMEDIVEDISRDVVNSADLQQHLHRLKTHERELLFLSVVEGYTADEIALMTESVRGTVLSTLFRVKKKLRLWIEQHEDTPSVRGYSDNVVNLNARSKSS